MIGRCAVLSALLGFLACEPSNGEGARSASDAQQLVGRSAPPFDLPAQAGGSRASIDGARGKVILVDFWATWCDPCKESFPRYQALMDEFDGELEIIGISVDDEPDSIQSFAKETGVMFPLAWDRDKRVAKSYDPQAMPTSFLIDRDGIVRRIYEGYHSGDEKKIEADVRRLLR
jgi:peroxiredoxin